MNDLKQEAKQLPDQEIIRMVLEGNINLYEILMRRYNQRLYRIGRSFFRDDDEVEDLMQFAYVKAFEKLSDFENRSSFSTWLIRIFINDAIARKKYRGRFVQNNDDEDTSQELFEKTEMNTPEKSTVNNELKGILEKAIDSLPEKYKVVFIMHEIENISVKETGDCLALTTTNVKVRLNRARKMLRDKLSEFYNPEDLYSFNLVRCDVIVKKVFEKIGKKELI